MDKKRFNAVKSRFPETKEFIDDTLSDECEKEKITADEVIFYKFRSKELALKNIFVLDFCYSDYCLFIGVADSKKIKPLSKSEIKKQLLESVIINEVLESEELNKRQKIYKNLKKQQR